MEKRWRFVRIFRIFGFLWNLYRIKVRTNLLTTDSLCHWWSTKRDRFQQAEAQAPIDCILDHMNAKDCSLGSAYAKLIFLLPITCP